MPLSDVFYSVLNGIQKRLKAMPDGSHAEIIAGYDLVDDMIKVKSVQKKFRDSFSGSAVNPDRWDTSVGAGASVVVAGGVLTMSSGTTANAETYLLSKETFTIPFRLSVGMTLSQRIANQTFMVEAVSVNPDTGIPDGLHACALVFDGATAAQAKYRVQNGGLTPLDSAVSTFPTTASGSVYEVEPFADEAWFHGGTLDSNNGRSNSYRRHQQIPDPNAFYKIRFRWLNGSTAPASSTNAVIQYVACQDYAELTAEITAGRGQSVAGQALGVAVTSMPATTTVTVSGNPAVVGAVAHDGARGVTAPIVNGARAVTAAYTAVQTGDVADLISTLQGVLVTRPWQIPELEWSYAAAQGGIVDTVDVILAAAAGVGLRRFITSIMLSNSSATATEVVIKDGATVIWRAHLPANAPMSEIVFSNPLKTTANTALNVACITAGAAVYVNAQGFTAA